MMKLALLPLPLPLLLLLLSSITAVQNLLFHSPLPLPRGDDGT
jgi:hypothetical protein